MIRKVTGIRTSHSIRPFILTSIRSRALIKRDEDNITQKQGSTTLVSVNQAKNTSPEKNNSCSGIRLSFFSGIKELEAETSVSTLSPAPTK